MALWLYGSLFVHENGREVFYGYDHSHDDLCVSAYGGILPLSWPLLQGS